MYNKIGIIFVLVIASMVNVFGQQDYQFTFVSKSNYTGDLVSTDDRGNILIAARSKLTKLVLNGHFIANYFPMFQAAPVSIVPSFCVVVHLFCLVLLSNRLKEASE